MFIFFILVISTLYVSGFLSRKSNCSDYGRKKPRIKFENIKKSKLPDNFLEKEAIIFNNLIKNNKDENKSEDKDKK